jgi:hypothetical protein
MFRNGHFEKLVTGNAQPKDHKLACGKPILLTSPQKVVELVSENTFKIENVVLVLIFESGKIAKNEEYKKVIISVMARSKEIFESVVQRCCSSVSDIRKVRKIPVPYVTFRRSGWIQS